MCVHCGGHIGSGGQCIIPPTPPQPPPTVTFGTIPSLARCETLTIGALERVTSLLDRLRSDPFAEAFAIYKEELKDVKDRLRNLSTDLAGLGSQCSRLNIDAGDFDRDANSWNQSVCVAGVPENQSGGCRARHANLVSRRTTLQRRYDGITSRTNTIEGDFQSVTSRGRRAIENASNVINPANTEHALRLYILHIFKTDGQPPSNSCRAFYRIASTLGKRTADDTLFIDMLARNLIEFRPDVNLSAGTPPATPWAEKDWPSKIRANRNFFSASGFKGNFVDKANDNQVRHAVGYMLFGYKLPVGVGPAAVVSQISDIWVKYLTGNVPEPNDFHLAIASAQLGLRLADGRLTRRTFGDALGAELCR